MRTLEAIKTEMDSVQSSFPTLTGLDTTSDTGIFTQMRNMWALLVQLLESSWDSFQAKMETELSKNKVGDLAWYIKQAKLFQYGDAITVINGQLAYAVVDVSKNIIVQSTITEDLATGRLTLRIAKKGADSLLPLDASELSAAKEYVSKFKFAGVVVDVLSLEADQLKLVATVKVDRQIMSLAGALLSDSAVSPVIEAINAYLSSIPQSSLINNTALIDVIQRVNGVKDVTINQSYIRRPSASTWSAYSVEIVSTAGHGVLHSDSVITYTY